MIIRRKRRMSKESDFLIYCMERYRYYKGISGMEVSKVFDQYDVYQYIVKYFEALHTMGEHMIVEDIDSYIENSRKCSQI